MKGIPILASNLHIQPPLRKFEEKEGEWRENKKEEFFSSSTSAVEWNEIE